MGPKYYSNEFWVDEPPDKVLAAIADVRAYWSPAIDGTAAQEGDEFVYRDHGIRFSRFRVTEITPEQRAVWKVLDSHLNFVDQHDEWTGTRVIFELTRQDDGTLLHFTHEGLSPTTECFSACSRGWDGVIGYGLKDLITGGSSPEH